MRSARWAILLVGLLLAVACSDQSVETQNAVSGLRVDTVLGGDSDGYLKAEGVRPFNFPEDHGPHEGYRSEWWYLTAVLKDDAGNDYGLHYTLFRQALTPKPPGEGPWQTGQAYLAHLAITDVQNDSHLEAERFARGHPALAGVRSGESFSAVIEDWAFAGDAQDKLSLALNASEPGAFAVNLSVDQQEPILLQGDRGWSEKGPGSASYYYSMPRLKMAGDLNIADKRIPVTGYGWLDREWSTSLLGDYLTGWDWFALQLIDDRSVMAFQLRRKDGGRDDYDHGLLVSHAQLPDGNVVDESSPGVTLLKPDNFKLTATRFHEDHTGSSWPVTWELQLPDEVLTINAMVDDQRMDLSIVYWEGIVEVLDSTGARVGRGYMELTGYADERR